MSHYVESYNIAKVICNALKKLRGDDWFLFNNNTPVNLKDAED